MARPVPTGVTVATSPGAGELEPPWLTRPRYPTPSSRSTPSTPRSSACSTAPRRSPDWWLPSRNLPVSTWPGSASPTGKDRIVLGKSVNTLSRLVDGLVVPVGVGLGGRVLAARRAYG